MNRIITLNDSTTLQKIQYQTMKRSFKFGPVSLNFLTIIIIFLLALFYLIQSQQSATRGYVIKDLEEQKNEIISQNERLKIEISKLKSIENIQNAAQDLQLVPTTELNYLNSQALTKK